MKIVVDLARGRSANSRRLFEVFEWCFLDRPRRSEMHQQRALARGSDPGNVVKRRGGQALRPLLPVLSDCESVSFVTQALEIEQQSRVGGHRQFAPAGQVEC